MRKALFGRRPQPRLRGFPRHWLTEEDRADLTEAGFPVEPEPSQDALMTSEPEPHESDEPPKPESDHVHKILKKPGVPNRKVMAYTFGLRPV